MTKKLFFLLIFLSVQILKAQDNQTVALTVNGQGKTLDAANQNALRNAIEQSFGTFISSKTELLNDSLLTDEISSISNGNIQKYDILSKSQLPDGSWTTILKVVVSVTKLTSFVEAKGVTVEFKGSLFTINIKQQLLNEQGEIKAIQNMTKVLLSTILQSFDYSIKTWEPKSLDAESKNWVLPINITAKTNKNYLYIKDYLIRNLSSLCLNKIELSKYQSLNKRTFCMKIDDDTFYFRNISSFITLTYFFESWKIYIKNYKILSNLGEIKGTIIRSDDKINIIKMYHNKSIINENRLQIQKFKDKDIIEVNLCEPNSYAATFNINLQISLAQMEKLTTISVEDNVPNTSLSIGDFYEGGIIFQIDSSKNHGTIISPLQIMRLYDSPDYNTAPPYYDSDREVNYYSGYNWSLDNKYLNTLEEIGAGKENTLLIMESFKESETAAKLCTSWFFNGYTDWFLPSIDELMLAGKRNLLKFKNENFWSSSEKSADAAYFLALRTIEDIKVTVEKGTLEKNIHCTILPVRYF